MSAGHVRSLALLGTTMLAVLIATFAVAAPAQAAKKRPVAKCSTAHVAKLKATATRKANRRTSTGKRRSAARRKALRASYLAQSLRRAGCSARKDKKVKRPKKQAGPKRTTTTTTTTTTVVRFPANAGSSRPKAAPATAPRQEQSGTTVVSPSAVTSQSWWTGMQGGANTWDARVGAKLGAKVVRVEFAIGTTVAAMRTYVADYADRGIRILPLAGFHGRLPSVAEAQNLATWTKEFGPGGSFWASRPSQAHLAIRHIEFGNETSFAYQGTQKRGGEYAQRVRDAFQAIQATGDPDVGLLVQADNANQSDNWVAQMYAAVPNVHEYAAGWTVHPYGPRSRWQDRIDEVVIETAKRGAPSTMPIDITEWGLSTDNGRCLDDNYGWNRCMTYSEAADALTGSIDEMRARYGGRIRHFLIYNGRDLRTSGHTADREHYFGLTTLGEQDKGAFTAAAREVLAAG